MQLVLLMETIFLVCHMRFSFVVTHTEEIQIVDTDHSFGLDFTEVICTRALKDETHSVLVGPLLTKTKLSICTDENQIVYIFKGFDRALTDKIQIVPPYFGGDLTDKKEDHSFGVAFTEINQLVDMHHWKSWKKL